MVSLTFTKIPALKLLQGILLFLGLNSAAYAQTTGSYVLIHKHLDKQFKDWYGKAYSSGGTGLGAGIAAEFSSFTRCDAAAKTLIRNVKVKEEAGIYRYVPNDRKFSDTRYIAFCMPK